MKGDIIIHFGNGQTLKIFGATETDYEQMLIGKEIVTEYRHRVRVNLDRVAVIFFEPERQ